MWIVDRHPVHRSNAVQEWLQKHRDKIEMQFLPSYSPQLNPTEYRGRRCQAGGSLETTNAKPKAVERTSAIPSAQTTKVTSTNYEVFSAPIHRLCCLNKCRVNHCRVNMSLYLLERLSLAGIARVNGVSELWRQRYVNAKYAAVPRYVSVSAKKRGT